MSSLQVRELPEHIYRALCHEAEAAHRSLAQQAVAVLARGLRVDLEPRVRRKALLAVIREQGAPGSVVGLPDPALLIREDRER